MAIINNVGQKIKGKAQQFKGKVKRSTGDNSGIVDQVKGKANEFIADVKINADKNK